ncbi:hypothetical protein [Nocardioides limicola]|uniref:hypothetical protein n=1 Tax=Nocardioides limicola TaxID=2803368 RepID=UPI00193BE9B8|nr:hypothetical protein [Nocardioides sp. DJM-14]
MVLTPVLILITARAAAAADGSAGVLDWIVVEDSYGVSIWQYEMSLDRGGVTAPFKGVFAMLVDLSWQAYRAYVAIAIWILDWALGFSWLGWLAGPVIGLGDALTSVVDQFGLTTVLATITACAAVLWMARGRWVLGFFELFLTLVIASLAIGVLANPVDRVAGDEGLLVKTRDASLALAVGLNNGGNLDAEAPAVATRRVTSGLADALLRKPHQLVNFGKILDGTECEMAYQDAILAGPHYLGDDLRDAVGRCDPAAGQTASNPSAAMVMNMWVLAPAASFMVIFAVLLSGTVVMAGLYALYQSLKLIIALVLALLPGSARGSLWTTAAELVIAVVMIVFTVVFLSGYLLLLQGIFDSADGGRNNIETFFVVDILMLVGLFVFWKGRKRIKAATEKMARAMSTRPGGGPTQLPAKIRSNPAELYYKGRMALGGAKVAAGVGSTAAGLAGRTVSAAGRTAYAPVGQAFARIRFANAAANTQSPGSADATPAEALTTRLRRPSRTGQLVRIAAHVGAAAATGGASAATGAAGTRAVAAAARRAALTAPTRASTKTPHEPRPLTPRSGAPTAAPSVVPGEVLTSTTHQPRPLATVTGSPPARSLTPQEQLRARLEARLGPRPSLNSQRARIEARLGPAPHTQG